MATRRSLRSLASGLLALLLLGSPAFAEGGQDALQLGAKLFEAGKLDEALEDFAQAAEAPDASTAKVAAAYAGLCYLQKADYDLSIGWFERALDKDPEYLAALENLTGACFARQSTYDKGMQIARRAETLYSRESAVYYNMACYYALAKRADLALRNLDKALYFGFSDLEHLADDEDFAGVRELEPCRRLFARLDSVGAAKDLQARGDKKSAALGYGEAKQLYEDSLKRYEDALGEGSVAGTACLLALGSVSLATGQFDAAVGYDEKALNTQIEILGSENPDVATCLGNLGLARYYKGEYDVAIEHYKKALAIQLKALGDGHPNVAASYNNLGGAYYSKGELDRSIEYYEKALAIWAQTLGPEHPRVAAGYDNLGNAYESKGASDEAIKCYSKALAMQLKSLGAEHPDVAQSYDNLGGAHLQKGEYDQAIEFYGRALAIQAKVLGEEHPETAQSYSNLGVAYQNKGEYARAIDYGQKALAIRLKALGAEHPLVAESYINLGAASYFYGAFDGAIDYYEKALGIRMKKLGMMHPYTALCYFGLGGAYYSKGEYDEAIDYVDKAVAIQQAALGEEHPDLAKSYIVLGQAYRSKGEFDRAVGYFQKALAIQSKILGEANPDLAHGYDNLGSTYDSEGDYDQAIDYYQKALAIRLKVLGEWHLDVAQSYVSLANVYYAEGDCDRAIDFDEKAVAIQIRAVGKDNPLVAQSYNNLGVAFSAKGEGDRAIDNYEKALAIQLKTLGTEHPNVALSYENLGDAWYRKGEGERAIDYEGKALALARKCADRQLRLQIARNLGTMELELGRYEKAKRAFLEGVAVIEEARGETGGGKAEFMARNISVYYLSLEASAALKDISGVFDAAEAMRARGFMDRLSLSAALSVDGVSPESRAKMLTLSDQLESLARRRSAEIQKPEAQQDKEALLSVVNEMQAAEKEFSDLDRSLMGIGRYKELRNPSLASLDDAQKLLDGSQAILEYVLREEEGQRQAWCLVIRNTGTELVRLEETFDFSGTVADFRQAILRHDVGREGIGERLYEKIIAPVKDRLSGAQKIIIVPDGALAFLPFDALRKDASSPYLAEVYAMSLAPSVSVLRMVAGRAYGGREQRWLAFGGALYSREGSGAQRGRRELAVVKALGEKEKEYSAARGAKAYFAAKGYEWSDLPGTRSEVLAIDRSVYGGAGTRVLLGADASVQMVKRLSADGELERQRVLHFACHGIFDQDFPAYSAVVLSEVSGEVKGSSAEDGYLTVEDVAKLRLKADMVELSACETGLGKVIQGDGVIGLARAFMVAGANGVGTTLWVVDDIATKDFMVRVYGLVEKEGMGFTAAMAEVKREFIESKDYSDPYYWSPFAIYGN